MVLVPGFLKDNPIRGTNQEKGAVARLATLPETSLLRDLAVEIEIHAPTRLMLLEAVRGGMLPFHPELNARSARAEDAPSPRARVQDQDQDQKQDQEKNMCEELFEDFWAEFIALRRNIGKVKAKKAWRTTVVVGRPDEDGHAPVDPRLIVQAAKNYRAYCQRERTPPKYVMHPSTFLGPHRRWEDWLGGGAGADADEKLLEWAERRDSG
jgi:hypothetical protein